MDRQRKLVVTAGHRKTQSPLRIVIRLTPKGGRDAIEDWHTDASGRPVLKARVCAPAHDGEANAALIALIADEAGVAKSKVRIVSGGASRIKTVEIACGEDEAARLQQPGAGH
jgi:uncharacterized protein YggU (UPF0235/DUF167 family)